MPVEEVVWEPEEHTRAKHKILRGYLDAWAPIMAQQSHRISVRPPLYIDAFAGPGVYKDGADGSPIIAIKSVLENARQFSTPIRMGFIEADARRFRVLQSKVEPYRSDRSNRLEIEQVLNTSCEDGLRRLIEVEKKRFGSFGRALVFLDQFGYSQAPMELIGEVMSGGSCEVFIYLDYRRMNHTLADSKKEAALTRAFGSDTWRKATELEGSERVSCLRDLYKDSLTRAGSEYVWDFQLRGLNNELLSWLFFCTSSMKGLAEMKRSMYRLDLTGNFRFSDRDVHQLNLLETQFDTEWLEAQLLEVFGGRTTTLGRLEKYVLTETPLISFKKALGNLEVNGGLEVLDPPPGRKRRSFNLPDDTRIKFAEGPGRGEQTTLF